MHTIRISLLSIVLLPLSVVAIEYANPYEADCRAELGLSDQEVTPGTDTARLRSCIRRKTTEQRRMQDVRRKRASTIERKQEIFEQKLEKQQQLLGDIDEFSVRSGNPYETECRKQLGFEGVTLKPGPQKATLRSCINMQSAKARRQANLKRRRSSVIDRSRTLGDRVLDRQTRKVRASLEKKDDAVRMRLRNQLAPDRQQIKQIQNSFRARSFFSGERIDSRSEKRRGAAACRSVTAEEFAECIRQALN